MSDLINSSGVIPYARQGTLVTWNGQPMGVGPKCDDDAGRWFCAAHGEGFPNNFMFWNHNEEGKPTDHLAVWVCFTHGPEVP